MNLIKTGTTIHLMKDYAPVIVTLAQMVASEEDVFMEESSVDRIKKLMKQVVGRVRKNLDNIQATERKQASAFQVTSSNLN